MNNINGIVLINKDKGITSFKTISAVRKILSVKKIGHTGTLDIDAKGLLVCLVGNACSMQNILMDSKKEYIAEMVLGIATDTEDDTGVIVEKKIKRVDFEDVKNAIKKFIGGYNQIPPMYSSKKINGVSLLKLAKSGKVIDRKPCHIDIYSIDILDRYEKNIGKDIYETYKLKISCGKGTYIRTLCKDIGEVLNIPSCMGELIRTKTGGFSIEDSNTVEEIEKKFIENNFSFIKPALYTGKDSVVTFGKFETMHIGHKKIIKKMVEIAKEKGLISVALVVNINNEYNNIVTREQQMSYMKSMGVDKVLYFPMNDETKNMKGEDFVYDILKNQIRAKYIVVGEDCSFGKGGECDITDLKRISKERDINIEVVKTVKITECLTKDEFIAVENALKVDSEELKEKKISSTLIKKLMNDGLVNIVEHLVDRKIVKL